MSTQTLKVGSLDDPVWDQPVSPSTRIEHPHRPFRTTVLVVAALLLLGAIVTWFVWSGNPSSGDPGGRVMKQLTPVVSSLPGYGTTALPWVRQIPSSSDAPYIISTEPKRDSCDGMAGTQGWSQVVVQAQFQWDSNTTALVAHMDPRLSELGWTSAPQAKASNSPSAMWTKSLNNGTRAVLDVTQEGGPSSSAWQLDALGQPVGKSASC